MTYEPSDELIKECALKAMDLWDEFSERTDMQDFELVFTTAFSSILCLQHQVDELREKLSRLEGDGK